MPRSLTILLLAALAPVALRAQAPAGAPAPAVAPALADSLAREILGALGSGEPAHRARLIGALTDEARARDSAGVDSLLAELHATGGGFDLLEQRLDDTHLLLRVRSRLVPRVALLHAGFDRGQPGRLRVLELLESHPTVADETRWPEAAPASEAALVALIDANLRRYAEAGYFSGAVRVEKAGRVLLERGYGLADREHGAANTPESEFPIASMGKMFTATAIAQLVQAGKLRFDDTLGRVLPEYPNAERARTITIRQLLEHSAGLGDLWNTPRHATAGKYTGQLAIAAPVAWAPLQFEPGTRFGYSNEGYVVLAAVVEKVSGEPFEDYLRRHVFQPAGMSATLFAGPDDVVPHRAVGYRPAPDDPLGARAWRANWSFVGRGGGAGGEYSNVRDMARFAAALRAGTLLDPALRDTLWTPRHSHIGPEGDAYGFGAMIRTLAGHTVVGHGGGGGGSGEDNEFRFATDGAFTIVVLGNLDPPAATRIGAALSRLLASAP